MCYIISAVVLDTSQRIRVSIQCFNERNSGELDGSAFYWKVIDILVQNRYIGG
jgi:hypothetical protein